MIPSPRTDCHWIEFILMARTDKTCMWDVVTTESGVVLGRVKWFGRWRKYAFFPAGGTVYEPTCLRDIVAFLDEQMLLRRKARS